MPPKAPRIIGGRGTRAARPSSAVDSVSQSSKNQHVHVSVRQIDNGFIVRREVSSDGDYQTSEKFTKKPPKLVVS